MQVTADFVEAVLLWEDAWLSARVLCLGMYVLICFRQLAQGMYPMSMRSTLLSRHHAGPALASHARVQCSS